MQIVDLGAPTARVWRITDHDDLTPGMLYYIVTEDDSAVYAMGVKSFNTAREIVVAVNLTNGELMNAKTLVRSIDPLSDTHVVVE